MPPRHAYWTIIFGNQPTSFRTATREELLPTFKQIQARHPDAVMMWFARGRLWKSEEEARDALFRRREEHRPRKPPFGDRPPPTGDAPRVKDRWRNRPPGTYGAPPPAAPPATPPATPKPHSGEGWKPRSGEGWKPRSSEGWKPRGGEGGKPHSGEGGKKPRTGEGGKPPGSDDRRGRDWRPGGQHKDPRDRFKVPRDVKRARFKAQAQRDRFDPKPGSPPATPKPRSGEGWKPRGGEGGKPRSGEGWKPRSSEGWKPRSGEGGKPRNGAGGKPRSGEGWKPRPDDRRPRNPRFPPGPPKPRNGEGGRPEGRGGPRPPRPRKKKDEE